MDTSRVKVPGLLISMGVGISVFFVQSWVVFRYYDLGVLSSHFDLMYALPSYACLPGLVAFFVAIGLTIHHWRKGRATEELSSEPKFVLDRYFLRNLFLTGLLVVVVSSTIPILDNLDRMERERLTLEFSKKCANRFDEDRSDFVDGYCVWLICLRFSFYQLHKCECALSHTNRRSPSSRGVGTMDGHSVRRARHSSGT